MCSSPPTISTAVSIHRLPVPCAVGIDSLYVSFFIDGLGIDWEALRFEQEKLRASPGQEHAFIEFGGETFALKRSGRKPYSFVLSNRAFELKLGEKMHPRCHAQFSSEVLWREGLEGAWGRILTIWKNLGCLQLRPEKISRVDAAFDFPVAAPDFAVDHFLSRTAKDATWREGGKLQSIQFGTSDVVVRVYDKVAEIEQESGKHWLFDIWGIDRGVWRFEFQVRSDRLEAAGIETIEQLRAYLPGLIQQLAQNHTSLRIPGTDSNRSRWPRHPLWESLLLFCHELTVPPAVAPRPHLSGTSYRIERQLQSVMGDLKGLAATLSRRAPDRPVTLDQLMNWLPRVLKRRHSPELWHRDILAKIRKQELGL